MAARESTEVYQLKVTLRHIRPPIWRRIQVYSDTTLGRLHDMLQWTMGWEDCHLHIFDVHGEHFGPPDPDGFLELNDERIVPLAEVAEPGTRFRYDYDFGDGWEHDIAVEKVLPPDPDVDYPVCLKGKRECPPEDCGGPWGYAELLEALADPSHERHHELMEWTGGGLAPDEFDASVVNDLLSPFRKKKTKQKKQTEQQRPEQKKQTEQQRPKQKKRQPQRARRKPQLRLVK